tara:strand:+ start:913 stop:1167 length:255 start_codon:yes stop_codon:yes gene_type:complete
MKWFVVAMMAWTYENGQKDYYVFQEPVFDSKEECMTWGSLALPSIKRELMVIYQTTLEGIEMISCVDENVVNNIASKDVLNKEA